MTTNRAARGALLGLVAIVLLGTLGFLYWRTEAIDFKKDAETLSLLRELKELDARWDSDAERYAATLEPGESIPDRRPTLARILRELERVSGRPEVSSALPAIREGLLGKGAALESPQGKSRKVGRADGRRAVAPRRSSRPKPAGCDPRIRATRSATPRSRPRRPPLPQPRACRKSDGGSFAARLATLREAALAAHPSLAEPASRAQEALRTFLAARAEERGAAQKFGFLTAGGRVDLLSQTVSRSVQASLDDKERWRVYLFFYAAALLIGVGHLAARVFAAQAALKEANEGLEKRVVARTKQLSEALVKLKESEAQLVQSEKMSSLGQMVAGRGPRDQHAARLREEQRGHRSRPPAGTQGRREPVRAPDGAAAVGLAPTRPTCTRASAR